VHAALLALGLAPGAPCGWEEVGQNIRGIAPKGDKVDVLARWVVSGRQEEASITEWAVTTRDAGILANRVNESLIFAGSSMRAYTPPGEASREVYHADMEGTIVGLTCFGHETIAWSGLYSPDVTRETPHWIARVGAVPAMGTPVTIVFRKGID
jgi:GMP synthase-like glutamine amidotransferase